jgi:AcrR family transcriptional regulator
VIEAVMPLLLEHGEGVTCRHLARAAGVSEGTLFNVFTDKDELLAAALESALDPAPFELAVSQIDPTQPFEQQLVAATRLHPGSDRRHLAADLGAGSTPRSL